MFKSLIFTFIAIVAQPQQFNKFVFGDEFYLVNGVGIGGTKKPENLLAVHKPELPQSLDTFIVQHTHGLPIRFWLVGEFN